MLNKRKFKGGLLTFWTDPVMLNHKYIYVKSAICRRKEAATVEEVMEKVLRSGMDLLVGIGRYALPALAFLIVLRCLFSLLRNRPRPVTLGILVNGANGDEFLLNHWLIIRSLDSMQCFPDANGDGRFLIPIPKPASMSMGKKSSGNLPSMMGTAL